MPHGRATITDLVQAAWQEAKINASMAGYASESMLGAPSPPRDFIDEELGFGVAQGPSLPETLLRMETRNRKAREMLAAEASRKPRSRKRARRRESGSDRAERIARAERWLLAT